MAENQDEPESLRDFAAAAMTDGSDIPAGLRAWNSDRPAGRFHVYRNNVRQGLTSALAARYPVVERLVGPGFFAALASAFLAEHPPRSPVLLEWGDGFADYIDGFAAARSVPYLADIARIEAARSKAYHAADAGQLAPEALAAVAPGALERLRLIPHPALAILRSPFPCVTIWERNQPDSQPSAVEEWQGEDGLITRPGMHVELRRLPPGCAIFLETLQAGAPIGFAAEAAANESQSFDLTLAFTILIESGAFTALDEGNAAS